MPQPVLSVLREQVDQARAAYHHSKEVFWQISSETHQDRSRIVDAARAQTQSMIAYTQALRRLNEFLLDGKIPEDLLEPETQRGGTASA